MRHFIIVSILFSVLSATLVRAAHTTANLIFAAESVRPGSTILAGVELEMEPEWHTYWKNPGQSGQATEIKWQLPPGVIAGEIQWPVPEKLPPAEVTTYAYLGKTVLIVPLTFASNIAAGPLEISANVSWLECNEACIQASAKLKKTLLVANENKASAQTDFLAAWQKKLPQVAPQRQLSARWEKPAADGTRSFVLEGSGLPNDFLAADKITFADFFPAASDKFEVQPNIEILAANENKIQWRKFVKKFEGEWPNELSGLLVFGTNDSRTGIEVKFPITEIIKPAATSVAVMENNTPAKPLWMMLISAFIGGLILNIMPCVLPVIALKILGFVSEAKSSPRRVRALGGIYTIGVLLSFLVLATLVIGVKAAGNHPGWGMQFGSPIFLVCLITLVTLIALNLFGVFEVVLGGGALNTAGELASKSGASGAFFNGVLATVLATPCTAPFLGAALGFAFLQPASIIILIFLTVGLGLSTPYLVLSWNPAWLKFLPKPGAWMEKFKVGMGFPMLATVVWLCFVAHSSFGKNTFWLVGFLVVLAFAAWVFGEFYQRGRSRKTLALLITFALLAIGYFFILEKQLHWRAPFKETNISNSLKESADGIDWQPWSPEAVIKARAAGKIVLVDFTADWCLTCQVNKRTSIEIPSVREALKSLNCVAFIADYTHSPANITAELNRLKRAGVPLVIIYPKNPDAPLVLLPEVLTPSLVLNALTDAAKN